MIAEHTSMRLRNHIPLAGPATREPCDGTESPLRVSLGFTPKWYHDRLGVNFDRNWHEDPEYRYESLVRMKEFLHGHFPSVDYFTPAYENGVEQSCATISGVFGILLIPMLYGAQPVYSIDGWPDAKPVFAFEDLQNLPPLDLDSNPVFQQLLAQMETIASRWGRISGYLNYQGILNIAVKLRGSDIFVDLLEEPETVKSFFAHIAKTIEVVSKRVQARQRKSGFAVDLLSLSNCTVSMISSRQYEEFVLPFDTHLSTCYPRFGIHTCNWIVDPYLDAMHTIQKIGYLDTGIQSDLARVRMLFPETRRALLLTPGEIEVMDETALRATIRRIASEYAPCDIVLADLETTIHDDQVNRILSMVRDEEARL